MSHIIDVIRARSLQSVLHLIRHDFNQLKANDKQYSYKLFTFHDKEECNEYIVSGFTEDIEHLLPFRNPNAYLVHFENRIYGIVVSAKSNYICGYIKEVVSVNIKSVLLLSEMLSEMRAKISILSHIFSKRPQFLK